jgi:DNA-binding transcriptional LysR family regulator
MTLRGKDLNLLVALRALLEEANVTRAGDRIQMGQSSMSSALSRLRLQFNDELLVRVGRDYELTPLARLLLPQVQQTLPLVERALGMDEPFAPESSHRVYTIMMSDYAAIELKGAIRTAMLVAPNIQFELLPLPEHPTDAERDLVKHDFVVTVPDSGIEGSNAGLFTDHYVCVVDEGNDAVVDGHLSWDAFTELPQAVCDFGHAHVTPADRKLLSLGFQRKAHVKTAGFVPLVAAIAGTDLVGIVPARLVDRLRVASSIISVPTPFERVEISESLWWHHSHDADPSHAWLREILISEAQRPFDPPFNRPKVLP